MNSWKRPKKCIFLALSWSTQPLWGRGKNPLNNDRLHFIICFLQFSRIRVLSHKMTALSSTGRSWSFTSLMNMKTISNKCHSCLNCQIRIHLKTPGKGFSCFWQYSTPSLVYKITCLTREMLIITRGLCNQSDWGQSGLLNGTWTGGWKDAWKL